MRMDLSSSVGNALLDDTLGLGHYKHLYNVI